MISIFIIFISIFLFNFTYGKVDHAIYIQPEQIHLSLGSSYDQMIVTWTTINKTADSIVWFGKRHLSDSAYGEQTLFQDSGSEKRTMYIHRVYLSNLKENTEYRYHVGSREGISAVFFFRTLQSGNDWSPNLIIYGDLGNGNAQTMKQMQTVVQNGDFDLLLHVGDFAYDLHDDNARVGDEFMRQIESIAAYIPYQVCPGNHEEAYNFSNYNNRFTMHSQKDDISNNFFWSYNIGSAHIISFTTEFYFYTNYGTHQIKRQLEWLINDLKKANNQRFERPWIITIGHRPLYSQYGKNDKDAYILRDKLEKILHDYNVDLSIWGHMHIYQRMYPVYQEKVFKTSSFNNYYINPNATVHIITGSAGCVSDLDPIEKDLPEYSALIYRDYGYSKLTIHNKTHLHWRQTAESKKWAEIDNIWIIKDQSLKKFL